jgi:uncharacterized protein with PIN domain
MVLDTSAILAILQDEPERRRFNEGNRGGRDALVVHGIVC